MEQPSHLYLQIQPLTGNIFYVNVLRACDVETIKRIIQRMEGYEQPRQILLLNDTTLHENQVLCVATDGGSVLQLVLSASEDLEEAPELDRKKCIGCGSDNPAWRAVPGCQACTTMQAMELECLRDQQEEAAAGAARARVRRTIV